jgi:phosphoribosylanthranilate isomerase
MSKRRGLKVCGVTRMADVEACCELGVDAIGFNLWPGSKRVVTPTQARALVDAVPRPGPLRIAVVVDPTPAELYAWLDELDVDLVQLHGRMRADHYPAMRCDAVQVVRGVVSLDALTLARPPPRWVLLDAAAPGLGGAGVMHDWKWARQATLRLRPAPVWLAGGITPENAAAAITTVDPAGIDVASGAEDGAPGVKSRARIARLRAICDNVSS